MKRIFYWLACALFLLTACAQEANDTTWNVEHSNESASVAEATEAAQIPSADIGVLDPERMIELMYDFQFETQDYTKSYSRLMERVNAHEAYVSDSYVDIQPTREKNLHIGQFTIKVPKDNAQAFITDLQNDVGTMLSQSTQTIDHTSEYQDNATRLSSEKTKLEALNALYARAETMEDIMAIQSQIIDTQTRIDQLEGSQKSIEARVDYTTVTLRLKEVFEMTQAQSQDPSFEARIVNAFNQSFRSFIDGMQSLLIAFIYLLPYIVIVACLIMLVRWIWKKFNKKRPAHHLRSKWRRESVKEEEKKDD